MTKRKTTAKGRAGRALTDAGWAKLKAEFVVPPRPGDDPETVQAFARRHHLEGATRRELLHRAFLERWEEEREAGYSRRWYEGHGLGATTEAEFCLRYALTTYAHLVGNGPEGYALAMAFGRDLWRRAMSALHLWEAHQELERAREAHRVIEERERKEWRERQDAATWGMAAPLGPERACHAA